jgi:hypothetical protein
VGSTVLQGEWKPKRITNKAYKGKWVAPDIDNPDFVDDPELYAVVKDNGLVGFELWQVCFRVRLALPVCESPGAGCAC